MATVPGSFPATFDEHRVIDDVQAFSYDSAPPPGPRPVAGLTVVEVRFTPYSPQTNW